MDKPLLIGSLLGKEELVCLLCSEYYRDPRILPCQDTFCRKCLQDIFDRKQAKTSVKITSILCPKCHAVTALPEIGVSGFPLDLNIRKKKEEFMEKLLDSARPSSAETTPTNKAHSLPKMARRLVEERQKEEEANRPSFMKHDWNTHILGSFDQTGAGAGDSPTDDLEYLKRSRPTFSPGTRRNLMVDGLIRSRRERSPHVSTRNAPSATPRFTPIDPNAPLDEGHAYRPFSGSRPARLASPRSKLNSGLHHKSDPGLDRTRFKSPTSPDGLLSPEFPGSRTETNNNIPGSYKAKDDIPEGGTASERQSRSRRQVHFKDGQPELSKRPPETTCPRDAAGRLGKDAVIRDPKSEETRNKINTRASDPDGASFYSENINTHLKVDVKPTAKAPSTGRPTTDANKVPSSFAKSSGATSPATSSPSSFLSSSDRKTASPAGSKSTVSPTSPPAQSRKTPTSPPEQVNTGKPSATGSYRKTSPQRRGASTRQFPSSPITVSSPISASSPISTSSPFSSTPPVSASSPPNASSPATAASRQGRESKVETVEFSETGRTSPGKVRRRPTIPSSLRSPTDKSTSPDARKPFLSPTRGRTTSPTQKTSPRGVNTLPRNHKPSVFTFDSTTAAKPEADVAPKAANFSPTRTSAMPTQSGVENKKSYDNNLKTSHAAKPADISTADADRDKEIGRVGGQQAELGRRVGDGHAPPSVSATRPQNSGNSGYQSRPTERPANIGLSSSSHKSPSRAGVLAEPKHDDRPAEVLDEKTVIKEASRQPAWGQRPSAAGSRACGAPMQRGEKPVIDTAGGGSPRRPRRREESGPAARGNGTFIGSTNEDDNSRSRADRADSETANSTGGASGARHVTCTPGRGPRSGDQIKGRGVDKERASGETGRVGDKGGPAGWRATGVRAQSPEGLPTEKTWLRSDNRAPAGAGIPASVAAQNRINDLEDKRRSNEPIIGKWRDIASEDSTNKDVPLPDKHRTNALNNQQHSATETNRTQTTTARDIPIFRQEPMNIKSSGGRTAQGTDVCGRTATANGVNSVSDNCTKAYTDKQRDVRREGGDNVGCDGNIKADEIISDNESEESGEESGRTPESSWSAIYQDIYDDITREISKEREKLGDKKERTASTTSRDSYDAGGTSDGTLNNSYDTDQSSLRDDTTQTPGGRISAKERQLGGATKLAEPEVVVDAADDEEEVDMTPEKPVYSTTEMWCVEKREYEMPTSLVILSNGTTVVAEFNSGHLQYFDAGGAFMHSVDGIKPFCITATKDDQVIVADRRHKTIRGFDQYGIDTVQWEDNQFKWISGIGCLANGNLVIYNRDNYKVGIYGRSGDRVFEFGSYGERDTQLCMADFLAVDSKDRILLCDSGNHCIKVFDVNGRFLRKFGTRGHMNGQMEWPKGICCDRSDNIVVADNRNRRVSLYSPDGEFIQHLVRDFASPYAVSLSGDDSTLGISHYALTGFSRLSMYKMADFVAGDASDETDATNDVKSEIADQSAVGTEAS